MGMTAVAEADRETRQGEMPDIRCHADRRRSTSGPMQPCSRRPTARVTGTQRLTADLCAQHARMAVDRPQLVREWVLRRAGRVDGRALGSLSRHAATAGEPLGGAADEVLLVAAEMTSLAGIRATLSRALARQGWPGDLQTSVILAVGEAVANAVEHGSSAGGSIQIALRAEGGRAWVQVTDDGRLGASVPLIDPAPPPATHSRGRGLLLMRRLSEDVQIRPSGNGTIVVLRFSSDPGRDEVPGG
jgi:anti-sigma regulatory factor (Ser/Thr protein kinase)